ncbi:LCP family protein [Nocardioides sp.]|uniref:LCP family protein n=1 Tax=Nocardioides sp. TaxID=35761 RepID=UPI0035157949
MVDERSPSGAGGAEQRDAFVIARAADPIDPTPAGGPAPGPERAPSRPPGARRAARSSRVPARRRPSGGARARRRATAAEATAATEASGASQARGRSTAGMVGLTVLGGLVPGTGYLAAGRRRLGALVLLVWLAAVISVGVYFGRDVGTALDVAFSPSAVRSLVVGLVLALLVWVAVVVTSHRSVRPGLRTRAQTAIGYGTVLAVVVAGGAPVYLGAERLLAQADLVETVLPENSVSATTPEVTEEDPWAGQDRVNVLLLGGDGGEGRTGVRTDSIILASIDTSSGKTVMFSLPRNLMYAQFPDGTPLHEIYPEGYNTGLGGGFDMINAIYKQVPEQYPGLLGRSDNEGADAIKLAVSGSLGVPVDYYILVNLEGFKTVVDAMGGITVNINQRVAIGGNTDAGIPPDDWLEPGPDQKLNGFKALWFARGRYGADDYQRMDRQRCAIDALIEAADPINLLRRYVDLAKAGEKVLYTDIPRKIASDFVELLLRVKNAKIRSVVFKNSANFFPGDPDYDYMRAVVDKALYPPKKKGGGREQEASAENPIDVCAYNPAETVYASD